MNDSLADFFGYEPCTGCEGLGVIRSRANPTGDGDECPVCNGYGIVHELEVEPPQPKYVPYTCHKCHGVGTVQKVYIRWDFDGTVIGSSACLCDSCNGSGIGGYTIDTTPVPVPKKHFTVQAFSNELSDAQLMLLTTNSKTATARVGKRYPKP